LVPILATVIATDSASTVSIVAASLVALGISGAVGAQIGGGHKVRAAARVFVGGGLAMAITALIGHIIGANL
jgi:VIT1/CCC1 family predicted Fe2+/Mn2+ transporter